MASFAQRLESFVGRGVLGAPPSVAQRLVGDALEVDGQRLDPQLQLLLKLVYGRPRPPIETYPVAEARELYREFCSMTQRDEPAPPRQIDRTIPGPAGEIRARITYPSSERVRWPAIVYFHGGGFVIGDLDSHERLTRRITRKAQCAVISVDYRLAPENRFPAAVDDAVAAYRWISSHAESLEIDPARIAIGGDSAGGCLATVVSAAVRDEARTPIFQLLFYPVTDAQAETASMERFANGFLLDGSTVEWFHTCYLDGADALDPRASPLRSTDLRRLPRALVVTAAFDVLRDEGTAYASALARAGVPVEHRCAEGMIHGFGTMTFCRAARIEVDAICMRLRDVLAGRADAPARASAFA
jgi:acetyl esterase